jgi:hypothetical protein
MKCWINEQRLTIYKSLIVLRRYHEHISGRYAIVCVGRTKVGKRPEASTHSLHLECIKACRNDEIYEDNEGYTLPKFRPMK